MSIITLTTDFGQIDGYAGVMKGVIWSIAPEAAIADITHEIEPQNIFQAALILSHSAPYFPPGTIHVAVVDPGVGTTRRPLLVQIGAQYFVGPDNGLVGLWLENAEMRREPVRFIHLTRPEYWLTQISRVFHGRDIFAPTAAYLANGVPFDSFGGEIDDPVRLTLPQPELTASGWRAQILSIDRFGNLGSNLTAEHIAGRRVTGVYIHGICIPGLSNTFGDRPNGELAALINSSGNLEIAQVNGSAARRLNAQIADPIEIHLAESG